MTENEKYHVPLRHERRSRAKKHLAWEQVELQNGGLYASNLREVACRSSKLSPMELRVCALVKALHSTREIAEKLLISEKTVENHRYSIRRKLRLEKENLVCYLNK